MFKRKYQNNDESNTKKGTKCLAKNMNGDQESDKELNADVLAVNVEYCDPFAVGSNHKRSKKYNDESDDETAVPKRKKPTIKPGDVIAEIDNILECKIVGGIKNYLIKWVGSKVPSWIVEDDFIEHSLLNDFHRYEKLRNDQSIQRRAYIYCRTSRRNVDKEVSLHDQEKYCLNYAQRNNINIIGIFKDNGVSAKDMDNQFGLNYLCDKIQKGECILIYDVSRFSRSMIQALEKLEDLRLRIGAIVHSVHDGITWNNVATSRASFRQNLSNSQLHSEVISEKILSSIEYRKDRGDHMGYVPYGYKTQMVSGVRKLVRNDDEMNVIQKIFDLAMDKFFERVGELNMNNDKKKAKSSKKTVAMKKRFKNNVDDMTVRECQDIANSINEQYTNRAQKLFTWRFIRNMLTKWKDNM